MSKMTLKEHRERLAKNKDKTDIDLPRCYKTFRTQLKACGYQRVPFAIVKEIVNMLWEAQGRKPFFYTENKNGVPYVWSRKTDWVKYDYFRYEWDHLFFLSENKSNYIENFALMTSRGSQQIQASMNIDEVLDTLGQSKTSHVVYENLRKRQILFKSDKWLNLIDSIRKYHTSLK